MDRRNGYRKKGWISTRVGVQAFSTCRNTSGASSSASSSNLDVGAAALCEVRRAAAAAADSAGEFADDLARVGAHVVGHGHDELGTALTAAEDRDLALLGDGSRGRAQFVHIGVDAVDDGRRVADVDLLAAATAAGSSLGELFFQVLDLLAPSLPLLEEPFGGIGHVCGRDVEDLGGLIERILFSWVAAMGLAGREGNPLDAVLRARC